MKKIIITICIFCTLIAQVSVVAGSNSSPETVQEESMLEAAVKNAVGETRLVSIVEKGTELKISFILSEGWSKKSTTFSFNFDVLTIWEAISAVLPDKCKSVDIQAVTAFVDKYGNTSTEKAFSANVSVATLEKINWEYKLLLEVPDLASKYWIHDTFKR